MMSPWIRISPFVITETTRHRLYPTSCPPGAVPTGTWVARICGTSDRYGLAREFLRPDARALTYELADGGIYQVQHGDGIREYILVAGQRAQPLHESEVWSLIRLPIAS